MKVLITGAGGFIGSHLVEAALNAKHEVVAVVRNPKIYRRPGADVSVIKVDFSKDVKISDWLTWLVNIDVVINCVGIIRESRGNIFDALHTQTPIALFEACEQAGVKRVIQISALGADETAFSHYHLSKRAADDHLMGLNLDWAVLMPSIVYGPGAKSMALFRAVSALPLIPLIDDGSQPSQPIHIDDLVCAVMQLVEAESPLKTRVEMVGPEPVTMLQLYTKLRAWLGYGQAVFISTPYRLALYGASIGGFLGNTPISADAVRMLKNGNTGDVTGFIDRFGFRPKSLDQVLSSTPAQEADRWRAGLYFLKPLLRISIGLLWLFTAIVSAFLFPVDESYSMLTMAGITGIWAPIMLYGAAAVDALLGIALLKSYRVSLVGALQIAVIILYTVIITFSQPEQWQHPFGPVSKNLPLITATLVMMALERRPKWTIQH